MAEKFSLTQDKLLNWTELKVVILRQPNIRYIPLEDLIEKSDIITINTPLTPETDGMFNRDCCSE